ncbi:MAG TPA: hypothetical protein VES42_24925 [Pilimelia sp.]|nr:hypothetical protein [Pilimelia sp.]
MGALVTLELPDDSPAHDLPWIITVGPLDDDEDWEPVVCGPYERPHALALAEAIVADDELMAVVEPLLPRVSVDEIRAEIAEAQRGAAEALAAEDDFDDDLADDEDEDAFEDGNPPGAGAASSFPRPPHPPGPEEIRAGFARIAARLASTA